MHPINDRHPVEARRRFFLVDGRKFTCEANMVGLDFIAADPAVPAEWVPLAGMEIVIVPDNNASGKRFSNAAIARMKQLAPQPTIRVVTLPGLPVDGDITDFMDLHDAMEPDALNSMINQLADKAPTVVPAPQGQTRQPRPILVSAASITPKPVQWLWDKRIPLGKLTLISGDPGTGKSHLTLDMAARLTSGRPWPDGAQAVSGSALVLCCEDDHADTVVPRLTAAGAELDRIRFLQGVAIPVAAGETRQTPFCLQTDVPRLEEALAEMPDCRLVVVDPISAYFGNADSNVNTVVRGLIQPLVELAAEKNVALVVVSHLTKAGAGGKAIYRTQGSIGLPAAARVVYHVAKDPQKPERTLFLCTKNNLAPHPDGLAYGFKQEPMQQHACLAWEADPVTITADELSALESNPGRRDAPRRKERNAAINFLTEALQHGPRPSRDIFAEAGDAGFTKPQIRRAFEELGGDRKKVGMEGGWEWSLPRDHAEGDTFL